MKYAARFLVVVLLLSLFTPCLQAEDALPFTYEIKNNEVILTSYTGPDSGTVVIPDEIEGLPVTTFGKNLFAGRSSLEYNLPKYLRRILPGAMPLDGKEITIPSTVTEIAPDSIWRAKAIHCERYSTAAQYADVEGIPVVYTDDATSGQEIKADGFTFWVKNGEATLVRAVSEERCTLYIPDHIYEYPVTQIASYTTRNNVKDTYHQDIYTSIVIPATVRRIDSYAFFYRNNYSRIRSIYLCEGVQSVGNYALYQSDIQADTVYLTLPNSLQEFGRDEEQLWNSRYIHVFAAENSVGAEYASRAAATFHNNHAADGTITGNYANMDFRIQNGEVTIIKCDSACGSIDPFLPSYIDGYPVTELAYLSLLTIDRISSSAYAVLPPTLKRLDYDVFGVSPENHLLLYYPGTPAEKLVQYQRYPYANIYDVLALPYQDVQQGDWYYSAVSFAYYNGLMNGVADMLFDPNGTMTRAMLVTVLWRLDGGSADGTSPYTDVPEGTWYTDGVIWATENGIVNGVGNGKFDPNGTVTREQIATILYRYAAYRGVDVSDRASLDLFTDAGAVSDYARAPMQWAVQTKLISGRLDHKQLYLAPQSGGTRAEVATILMRFLIN
ncbi:S-layer homology domain-containing protein [Faecousia sp.]|uniref:S-layer homology domain-containing protein n=1 Tax=Faecousia sp. TaxID=2952921 RepID=UPI003AF8B6FC